MAMCLPEKKYEVKYEFWLTMLIAMITGLFTGIITSSAYERDKFPAQIGICSVLLIGIIIIVTTILKPVFFKKYSPLFSTGLCGGLGTGLVIGIGTTGLYEGDYLSFIIVILVILGVIWITIKYRKLMDSEKIAISEK